MLGLSASSQAGLLAEIDRLGTNLLTVTNGQTLFGHTGRASEDRPGHDRPHRPSHRRSKTPAYVSNVDVYRSPLIPSIDTNALTVQAASLDLLAAIGDTIAARQLSERRHRP